MLFYRVSTDTVNVCKTLSQSGVYRITSRISGSKSPCISITGNNIWLEGGNYVIDAPNCENCI